MVGVGVADVPVVSLIMEPVRTGGRGCLNNLIGVLVDPWRGFLLAEEGSEADGARGRFFAALPVLVAEEGVLVSFIFDTVGDEVDGDGTFGEGSDGRLKLSLMGPAVAGVCAGVEPADAAVPIACCVFNLSFMIKFQSAQR